MTKVVPFTKFRILFPVISLVAITAGLVLTFALGGLNLGIDFKAGLNIHIQIAPVAARMSYTGDATVTANVRSGELVVTSTSVSGAERYSYTLSDYATLEALQSAVSKDVAGFTIEPVVGESVAPESILPLEGEVTLGSVPSYLNVSPAEADQVTIGQVRAALTDIGDPQIQTIGAKNGNEFMIRIQEQAGATDFDTEMASRVRTLLEDQFGKGSVLIRETNYIGARFSSNLGRQSAYLTLVAVLLILVYTWFRFKLAYAVSAILATVHDALFMFAFIGVTRLEFSTATIAAVLTIVGYSLNDTIVIFDRIRENTGILRGESFRSIIDKSVTQSLSRTLMTSLTTLVAIVAIAVFATGSVRDFAVAMVVGVVVGTYSSIFVASPILLGWTGVATRRRKARDAAHYGTAKAGAAPAQAEEAAAGGNNAPTASQAPSEGAPRKEIPKVERKLKGKRQTR